MLQTELIYEQKNRALSSPYRNFTFQALKIEPKINKKIRKIQLIKALEKVDNCGKNFLEFVNKKTSDILTIPAFCDNRICNNPDCKKHRGHQFTKNHYKQIEKLKNDLEKPNAYIFTGWVLPVESINRKWLQSKLKFLYDILKKTSISEFSVHMEIKLYPSNHRHYGNAYVHFHCVSDYITDIGKVRQKWKRVIRSEKALTKEKIVGYISKYTSKTPFFQTNIDRELYHFLVYKTQMHRFSTTKQGELTNVESDYYPIEVIEYEIYNELKKGWKYPSGAGKKPPPSYQTHNKWIENFEIRHGIKEIKKPSNKEISDFYDS